MLKLTDREWKAFNTKHLFNVINISKATDFGKTKPGNNAFVGRTVSNNGIQGFVTNKTVEDGNCISISMVGVVKAFYQPTEFVSSQNILILRKDELSKYIALFLNTCFQKQLGKFNYGRPLSLKNFNKMKVLLPIASSGEPDWQFMEDYTKERESKQKEEQTQHIKNKLKKLGKRKNIALQDMKWSPFRLENTFECTKGVYLPTNTVFDGNTPFITAKSGNNGLKRFIGNSKLFEGNRITIEKIQLSSYYQPAPFYCSHDVSVISGKSLNEYNSQFIATIIMRNGSKYSYGRQAQLNVVKRETILLPTTPSGKPNYSFMEQYIKNLMIDKYTQYLKYLESHHS